MYLYCRCQIHTFTLVESDCDSKTNIPAITFSTCDSKDISRCRLARFVLATMANKVYINFILLYNNMKIVTSTYTAREGTTKRRYINIWTQFVEKHMKAFQTNLGEKWKALTSQRFFRVNGAEMIHRKFTKVDKFAKNSSSHLSNPLQEKSLPCKDTTLQHACNSTLHSCFRALLSCHSRLPSLLLFWTTLGSVLRIEATHVVFKHRKNSSFKGSNYVI